jgi:acyl-CoA thioester hydrolase
MTEVHRFQLRVYYEDTDVGGMVYYANYLKYAERARTELLRAAGFSHGEMAERHDTFFAVSRCEIDYLRPARFDDLLTIETRVVDVGAAVINLEQRVLREEQLLSRIAIRIVCLNRQGRPLRLADPLRETLTAYRISEELV